MKNEMKDDLALRIMLERVKKIGRQLSIKIASPHSFDFLVDIMKRNNVKPIELIPNAKELGTRIGVDRRVVINFRAELVNALR